METRRGQKIVVELTGRANTRGVIAPRYDGQGSGHSRAADFPLRKGPVRLPAGRQQVRRRAPPQRPAAPGRAAGRAGRRSGARRVAVGGSAPLRPPPARGGGQPAGARARSGDGLTTLQHFLSKGVFPEGENRGRGARAGGRDLGKIQVPGLKGLLRHPGRRAFRPVSPEARRTRPRCSPSGNTPKKKLPATEGAITARLGILRGGMHRFRGPFGARFALGPGSLADPCPRAAQSPPSVLGCPHDQQVAPGATGGQAGLARIAWGGAVFGARAGAGGIHTPPRSRNSPRGAFRPPPGRPRPALTPSRGGGYVP